MLTFQGPWERTLLFIVVSHKADFPLIEASDRSAGSLGRVA